MFGQKDSPTASQEDFLIENYDAAVMGFLGLPWSPVDI